MPALKFHNFIWGVKYLCYLPRLLWRVKSLGNLLNKTKLNINSKNAKLSIKYRTLQMRIPRHKSRHNWTHTLYSRRRHILASRQDWGRVACHYLIIITKNRSIPCHDWWYFSHFLIYLHRFTAFKHDLHGNLYLFSARSADNVYRLCKVKDLPRTTVPTARANQVLRYFL